MSKTQAYYLEIKLFKALEKTYNNVKLKGVVQADEKYFRISFKGTKHKDMPRDTRHSGSQNLKIDINNELTCVVVAIDEFDNIIIKVVGNGPTSSNMIEKALGGKICENSILVTDSKNSYIKFAKDNNLILKQIPDGKHSVDGKYNLSEVNELILEIENYIIYSKKGISSKYSKKGISSKHLQQYCNFIKYRKILKYTVEYLERNEKMYMDTVVLCSNLENNDVSSMDLPFDVNKIFNV